MAGQLDTSSDEIALPDIPGNINARADYMNLERSRVIQYLAQLSRKARGVPDFTIEPAKSLFQRLDLFLRWLDLEVEMTPELRQRTKIDEGLKLMFNRPEFFFPQKDAEKARNLFENWESEKWGAGEVVESEDDAAEELEGVVTDAPSPKRLKLSTATSGKEGIDEPPEVAKVRLPPSNHPIFGRGGIMYGVAIKRGKRRNYILDPRFEKRPANVFGSNGLKVGAWFPMQMVALFNGAHSSAMGGIAGSEHNGAYSIVVAGYYDDLDQDHGDILYYSGSNSHDNKDPRSPGKSSSGTKALHTSLISQKPIRVLRSHSGKSKYTPICGLRYDGLYRIVSTKQPLNNKGGKYEQFKLVRLDDQNPIDRSRPSPKEQEDHGKISQGY